MKVSRLGLPHLKKEIVTRTIAGDSHSAIARDLKVAHTTIGRFLKKEDVQGLLQQESLRLLDILPDALSNIKEIVRGMSALDRKDYKGRELAFKASQRVLEAAGIFNSGSPAPTILTLAKDESAEVPPEVKNVLNMYAVLCQKVSGPDTGS